MSFEFEGDYTEGVPRQLGNSDLMVSTVGLGCWPISGVSSLDVNQADSLDTIHAALDNGINFFDTAYSYGYDGESDKLLAQVFRSRGGEVMLASKVGTHYDSQRARVADGRPETILAHSQIELQRLSVDHLDLLYLHQPDPNVPIEESAGGIAEAIQRGDARYAGVSNVNLDQLRRFHQECPVVAVQVPYNMLQQEHVGELSAFCLENNIGIIPYWVLMKGLLAGAMTRSHQFAPQDRRLTYEIYQGEQWQRSHDLIDHLRTIAAGIECTVAQLVVAWTLAQPGITSALCGAKRPRQIEETSCAMFLKLSDSVLSEIDGWIDEFHQGLPETPEP